MSYAAFDDPYFYPGTEVLKNIPGLRDQLQLDRFEAISFAQRSEEMLPAGSLSVAHFLAIHRHLFQDVYRWAGRPRKVRIFKGDSGFCYPENIRPELGKLFQQLQADAHFRLLGPEAFAVKLAHFLAELNAIHAFREGNGRAQLAFCQLVANKAGHTLHIERLNPKEFLQAMIASFRTTEEPLVQQLRGLL